MYQWLIKYEDDSERILDAKTIDEALKCANERDSKDSRAKSSIIKIEQLLKVY